MIEDQAPDLVLLDVVMPGIDGWQLLRQLEERHGSIPVIMFSGQADERSRHDRGRPRFVGKPFDPEELLARAKALVPSELELEVFGGPQQTAADDAERSEEGDPEPMPRLSAGSTESGIAISGSGRTRLRARRDRGRARLSGTDGGRSNPREREATSAITARPMKNTSLPSMPVCQPITAA